MTLVYQRDEDSKRLLGIEEGREEQSLHRFFDRLNIGAGMSGLAAGIRLAHVFLLPQRKFLLPQRKFLLPQRKFLLPQRNFLLPRRNDKRVMSRHQQFFLEIYPCFSAKSVQ